MMRHIIMLDALLCNLTKQANKKGAEKTAEKVTALISLGSPESNKNKRWGQDKHAPEMHSKLSNYQEG